ncbi:MAG: O-antigen ligase family protein [Chloroflexota bacterium]
MTRRVELLALAASLATFSYVGWDGALWDARFQLVLHLFALAAIGGLVVAAVRGVPLPRTPIDLPILVLLVALAVATLTAQNHGLAIRALSASLAYVLLLPVALLTLRSRPGWVVWSVALPTLALGLGALAILLWHRAQWWAVGGPGIIPPVRIGHEGTVFGSVAVPPFVLVCLVPLILLLQDGRPRRWLLAVLALTGAPLTLLSGSRSAWVALAVAGLILAAPAVRSARMPARWARRELAIAGGTLVVAALGLSFIAPRLTAISSLVYRGFLWQDTIAAWSASPVLGIGPGTMPYARQAAAAALTFPVRQPHSHNVPLGLLGDAGIVGLTAGLAVFAAFVIVARPRAGSTWAGRAAYAILIGLAVGFLFEDVTFLPGLDLLVILLAAIALADAGAVRWAVPALPRARTLVAPIAAAAALLVVLVLGDAGAVDYRNAIDAAGDRDWGDATVALQQSVALDPWHPAGPKSLAVAAAWAGDGELARASAERAIVLNPGDGASWTNLALLCLEAGDTKCARDAAGHAVDRATLSGREFINAAFVREALGDTHDADAAYVYSLLTNPWTSLTTTWPRPVALEGAAGNEIGALSSEMNAIIARRMLGATIDPAEYRNPSVRALANAMLGDRAAAREELDRSVATASDSPTTWEIVALLQRHWGEDPSHALAIGTVVRNQPLARGASELAYATFDIATFRGYPADGLVPSAQRMLPQVPWPWILEPLLATD